MQSLDKGASLRISTNFRGEAIQHRLYMRMVRSIYLSQLSMLLFQFLFQKLTEKTKEGDFQAIWTSLEMEKGKTQCAI